MFESDFNSQLADGHKSWLRRFSPQFAKSWQTLYEHEPESALCEAAVRRVLELNGNEVEPNEAVGGIDRSPDFRCIQAGEVFFVEVTCISAAKATSESRLEPTGNSGFSFSWFGGLTDALFLAAKKKTPQCSTPLRPALVAIGTFDPIASRVCFQRHHLEELLTGETAITQDFHSDTGRATGNPYLSTELRSAAFLRPTTDGRMAHARNPVSGVLACGFGCDPAEVRCALHPNPLHEFDRRLLPQVECCRLKKGYGTGVYVTEWF